MSVILGVESSCDETAVAIYTPSLGIIAHEIYSQIDLHQIYGGVVPELASRDHIRKTLPLIQTALECAKLSASAIDAIAYTRGPGLIGALMVGASIAKALAYAWQVPAVGVHHMEAHLMAALLEERAPAYPFLALLVSGGHTQLVQVNDFGSYILLGQSVDDAAGEAFDKTAKLLGLPYPGGPHLARLAKTGNPNTFHFPRPMTDRLSGLNFSFSGLKTHAVHCYQKNGVAAKADIAAAFEEAVIDTLFIKCQRALEQTNLHRLVVVGGVSANEQLRAKLAQLNIEVYFPRKEYCTDNGAMVAFTGYQRFSRGFYDKDQTIQVKPRWEMTEITD